MKRYQNDEDRPQGQCYDCGLAYSSSAWIDAVVSNAVWEKINPTEIEGAGLLCIGCLAARCLEAGLDQVPVMLASGPLVAYPYDLAAHRNDFMRAQSWVDILPPRTT